MNKPKPSTPTPRLRNWIFVALCPLILFSSGCGKASQVKDLLEKLKIAEQTIEELEKKVEELEQQLQDAQQRAETAEQALRGEERAIRRIYEE